jgi:hypothetical protein
MFLKIPMIFLQTRSKERSTGFVANDSSCFIASTFPYMIVKAETAVPKAVMCLGALLGPMKKAIDLKTINVAVSNLFNGLGWAPHLSFWRPSRRPSGESLGYSRETNNRILGAKPPIFHYIFPTISPRVPRRPPRRLPKA